MRDTVTIDDVFDRFENKYEAIIVIAREARRLTELNRTMMSERRDRSTKSALEKVLHGNVEFAYRKRVRPRPWPEMAGPEILETREEPVAAPPTGLWKDEEEDFEEDQEGPEEECEEDEDDEPAQDEGEEVEPSEEDIMAEDLLEEEDGGEESQDESDESFDD
jgi:DNA-directed RNA polymerase omega subunit